MLRFGKRQVRLLPPFAGEVVSMDAVPDQVFSQKMLGDGYAVLPPKDVITLDVCAPVSGRVVKVFHTLHAVGILSDEGLEILIHIGLDTVDMKGEGFVALVADGEQVNAGQGLIRVDVAAVRASGRDPITPVVLSKKNQVKTLKLRQGLADEGDTVCTVTMV
ncbi:PTS sugar transporter subunit IIA [Schaalia suimastitidis]|uniref:PTS sugar transporter subunit IIA n=1 Tax=Schaalia suimastitidis TaxID=121163 RepID=UPI000478AB2E|nr:PTS glucose transporter subunit IIA [Schaalia suimastitidis]